MDSLPHEPDIPAPACFSELKLSWSPLPTIDQLNAWIGCPGDDAQHEKGRQNMTEKNMKDYRPVNLFSSTLPVE
jgi:hypothetical protein